MALLTSLLSGSEVAPRYADDLAILADLAAQLLQRREERYPDSVARGNMTPEHAADGIRIMRAIAVQWETIVTAGRVRDWRSTWDTFGATEREMRTELARVASDARTRAYEDPSNKGKRDLADACAALAWQQQEFRPGLRTPACLVAYLIGRQLAREVRRPAEAA